MRELNLTEIEVVSGGSLSMEPPNPFPWKEPFGEVSNPWFQWGAEGGESAESEADKYAYHLQAMYTYFENPGDLTDEQKNYLEKYGRDVWLSDAAAWVDDYFGPLEYPEQTIPNPIGN